MGHDVYMFIKDHFHHMRPEESLNKIKKIIIWEKHESINKEDV